MPDVFDQVSAQQPTQSAPKSGDVFDRVSSQSPTGSDQPEPSFMQKVMAGARQAGSDIYGQIKGAAAAIEPPALHGDLSQGAASVLPPAYTQAVQSTEQGIQELPADYHAYEQARQQGKSPVEAAGIATGVKQAKDQIVSKVKQGIAEFEKNPTQMTTRGLMDAAALAASIWGPDALSAIRGTGTAAEDAEGAEAISKPGIVKQVTKGEKVVQGPATETVSKAASSIADTARDKYATPVAKLSDNDVLDNYRRYWTSPERKALPDLPKGNQLRAEAMAKELDSAGFDTRVTHHEASWGNSSYIKVTPRDFNGPESEVRISDHPRNEENRPTSLWSIGGQSTDIKSGDITHIARYQYKNFMPAVSGATTSQLKGGLYAFGEAGDSVYAKSKGLYKQIDAATDNQFSATEEKLRKVNNALRGAATDEEATPYLQQREKLLAHQDDLLSQAEKQGVPKETITQAKESYKQANALYDLDHQVHMARVQGGESADAAGRATLVDPKKLLGRLQNMDQSGRLAEAFGGDEQAAHNFMWQTAQLAKQGVNAAKIKRMAGSAARRTGYIVGGALGYEIVRHATE